MAKIKPTRSELIAVKKKIKLAQSGHSILKKKRDGLILEFFNVLKKVKTLRSELAQDFGTAQKKMNIARALDTDIKIKSIALALNKRPSVEMGAKNIMGVLVPKVRGDTVEKPLLERGYGVTSSTTKIDEAALAYERVVDKVVLAAEVEVTMRKLLSEIEKTKRKVNALERITIPNMQKDAAYVRVRLEEMERENFSRLKHIKKALA